jgi:hypothetical protein
MEKRQTFYKVLLITISVALSFTAWCATAAPVLQSPANGAALGSCSLINTYQPTFSWTATESYTNYTLLFSTSSTDFSTKEILIQKTNVPGTTNSWTPPIGVWKKILGASYNNGSSRNIYWTVIGKKPDKTMVPGNVRDFYIDNPVAVTIISPTPGMTVSDASSPTFEFNTNCNVQFRLEFSPLSDFSDSTRIKGFNFSTKNPLSETNAVRTLTYRQWYGVVTLLGSSGYFRIRAWDVLKRETPSEMRLLNIESALLGTWDISGKIRATVTVQGRTGSAGGDTYDEFTFNPDGTFDMIGISGTWMQEGNRFEVLLDSAELEPYLEDLFLAEGGLRVGVDLTSLSFTGTENVPGGTIAGKAVMTMDLDIYSYGYQGTARVTITFKGTKRVEPMAFLLEMEPTREWNSLFETIGENLRELIN